MAKAETQIVPRRVIIAVRYDFTEPSDDRANERRRMLLRRLHAALPDDAVIQSRVVSMPREGKAYLHANSAADTIGGVGVVRELPPAEVPKPKSKPRKRKPPRDWRIRGMILTRAAVFDALTLYGPLSDHGLVEAYNTHRGEHGWPTQTDSALRTNRNKLCREGLVHDTGQRDRRTMRPATIWARVEDSR